MQLLMVFTCLLSVLSLGQGLQKLDFTKFVTLCPRHAPNLNECATAAARVIAPLLTRSMPEYGMEDINPLKIDHMELTHAGDNVPVGLQLNITNSIHDGVVDSEILSVKIDHNMETWELHLRSPRYSISGVCAIEGKVLMLPITGHGACNFSSFDHDVVISMDGKMEKKADGKEYLELKTMKMNMTFTRGYFTMDGLYSGNTELSRKMLESLNENSVEVLNEVKPILEYVWANIYKEIFQKMFDLIPFDEMLAH